MAPSGVISTFAGSSSGFGGDGGAATLAALNAPLGVAVDSAGNVLVADTVSRRRGSGPRGAGCAPLVLAQVAARWVAPAVCRSRSLPGPLRCSLPPRNVCRPLLAPTPHRTRQNNHRVRRITPSGVISTVAGSGAAAFSGDGGEATSAGLYYPTSVAMGAGGALYVAELVRVGAGGGGLRAGRVTGWEARVAGDTDGARGVKRN